MNSYACKLEDGRTSYLTPTTGTDATFRRSYVKDDSDNILPLEVPSSEVKLHRFTAPVNGVLDYQVDLNLRHAMALPGPATIHYRLKPAARVLDVDVLSTISGCLAATTDT